jgi:hypothetical protein
MNDNDEEKDKDYSKQDGKKVTAAITDAPQEEFITDASVPSRTENTNTPEDKTGDEPRQRQK